MKALFLILLLNYSCTKYATVPRESAVIQVESVNMEVSHLKEIEWHVGKRKEETITQSFTFIVDLPKLKQDDLNFLTEQKGIDAWIVRLIADKGSEKQDLGSLYTLYNPRRSGRASSNTAPSSITMKVFYAAAYASERFRAFKCPAFEHNKRIRKMSIKGSNDEFVLSTGITSSYNEKSHQVELTPTGFNAGNSIVADYYIEIAPFDSKRKLLHSSFRRLPMYVSVESEDSVSIPSCGGEHPEQQK